MARAWTVAGEWTAAGEQIAQVRALATIDTFGSQRLDTEGHWRFAESISHGRGVEAEAAFAAADQTMSTPVEMPHYRHLARRLVAEAAIADGRGDPVAWLHEDIAYFATAVSHERVGQRPAEACCVAPVPRCNAGPPGPRFLRRCATAGVTGREREVLLLVTQGLPNREIPARLVLSPRTVKAH